MVIASCLYLPVFDFQLSELFVLCVFVCLCVSFAMIIVCSFPVCFISFFVKLC